MTGVKLWTGVPLHPERDGWHFLHHPEDLRPACIPWDAAHQAWCSGGMHSPQGVLDLGYRYLGPCLTPAEVRSQLAAARREGAEAMQAEVERLKKAARLLHAAAVAAVGELRPSSYKRGLLAVACRDWRAALAEKEAGDV